MQAGIEYCVRSSGWLVKQEKTLLTILAMLIFWSRQNDLQPRHIHFIFSRRVFHSFRFICMHLFHVARNGVARDPCYVRHFRWPYAKSMVDNEKHSVLVWWNSDVILWYSALCNLWITQRVKTWIFFLRNYVSSNDHLCVTSRKMAR